MKTFSHASLFSGIGGFDLAAEWMGWDNVLSCEFDPFCQSVLQHHFPTTTHYGDIRQLDGTKYKGQIDVLTGGFPCQPFSAAGQRRGTEDNRFLWPEMLRVIREVQPFCIPACAVGAPHRRERMWFIARSNSSSKRRNDRRDNREGRCVSSDKGTTEESEQERKGWECGTGEINTNDSNSNNIRLEGRASKEVSRENKGSAGFLGKTRYPYRRSLWEEDWIQAATRLCRVDDGISRGLDGITVSKWRKESIKAYGNTIVPQIAYKIFQSIAHAQDEPSICN